MKQFTFFTLLFCFIPFLNAQTILQGKVTASDTGEELISANIVLKQNGIFRAGVSTDFNGDYRINLDPGTYDVEVSYLGYPTNSILGVIVKPNQVNKLDVQMTEPQILIGYFDCGFYYYPPLIEIDNTTSGTIQLNHNIENSPHRNIGDLIISTPGVSTTNY